MTTCTVSTMVAAYRRAGFQPTKKRAGDGINGPCPCCGGTDRFWIGSLPDGGQPWMACSHGCSFEDMRSTLGLDASGQANGGGPGHKTVYSYTDEAGTPVFEVERRPALSGASGGGASEEADQGVAGAAPRARRVERVGGTSGGVMPRPGRRRAEGPAARVSAGRACPCRRRRAARRASHAPHPPRR
jgi:hypothetical protein